jgi:DNA helicase II / ATP-dependent DNA helicase PcrA
MALRREQIDRAVAVQRAAAHDESEHVRVVAGPGTGKSATIEERVCWLLRHGVKPEHIIAISFTRAASDDLQARVASACEREQLEGGGAVAVSTLHSLALRALRMAGALAQYPADPVVLQQWELRNIFEAEFGEQYGIGVSRRQVIRLDYEAFWCTGGFDPESLVPPDPPITDDERQRFRSFHGPTTQLYSCVLPGEVVAKCVEMMDAGTLDPAELLHITDLIVDEFQDLNPMDLRFVHGLAERGVRIFAAGDDDQSLYAFRFASPEGIEQFPVERPGTGDHTLSECFRCTPAVLSAAESLMRRFAAPGRIEKNLHSLWGEADPPVPGVLESWRLRSGQAEARTVAESCRRLIEAGIEPRQIMILLSSTYSQAPLIQTALDSEEVPYSPAREESITDIDAGRVAYALLSIVNDPQNYVAHRTLLGIRRGVGTRTCVAIAGAVIAANRNFRELFYEPIPEGLLSGRAHSAVTAAADICAELVEWRKEETLGERLNELCRHVDQTLSGSASEPIREHLADLPPEMTLEELHLLLGAQRDDDRRRVLEAVAERLELPEVVAELAPNRVQLMTMHRAKGLSAQVVFIPGLEDSILPGEKRRPYPGLVLEAARMLYVSITRARFMCVLTYAQSRMVFGKVEFLPPSRYTSALGVVFAQRENGLTEDEARAVIAGIRSMS